MKTNKVKRNIRHAAPGTRKRTNLYFLATFFIIAFVYFSWFGSYILFFQEQQFLFVYSSSFLADFFSKPGGLLDLSGKFLSQFYINSFAGSFILTTILILPSIILMKVNKSFYHTAIMHITAYANSLLSPDGL
jgi:hypothetical protein